MHSALGVVLGSKTEEAEPPTPPAKATGTTEDSSDPPVTSTSAIAKELQIGRSLDPSSSSSSSSSSYYYYYSTDGIWNGSGLAHHWRSFSSNYGDALEDAESLVICY